MKTIRNSCRRCIDFPYGLLWGNPQAFAAHGCCLVFQTRPMIVGKCRKSRIKISHGRGGEYKRFVGIVGLARWKQYLTSDPFVGI